MGATDEPSTTEDQLVASRLRSAGVEVRSVWDLVNSRRSYPKAIPVLVELLPRIRDKRTKEGVVRALMDPAGGRDAVMPLFREFQASEDDSLKWAIGNALAELAGPEDLDALLEIAAAPEHGTTRQMVVSALGKFNDPRSVDVLRRALEDEGVAGHAIGALGRLRARGAAEQIRRFLSHENDWIRKSAATALRRMGRA